MSENIESTYQNAQIFTPDDSFRQGAHVNSMEAYRAEYERSVKDPEAYWAEMAEKHVTWFKPWKEVMSYDFESIGLKQGAYVKFFDGAKLNVCYNCVDRHVKNGKADKTAIQWQGERAEETRTLTYRDLQREVNKFSNVLRYHGVKKGTVVTIYMPMIPEMPIALLACARIGAIHSVVFSAFSSDALRNRIQDCGSEVVITSDVSFHAGKVSGLKDKVDHAVDQCPQVRKVFVYKRGGGEFYMRQGRDFWWQDEMIDASEECPPESMAAEDPLFILYTSGSTGKPKGVLHTTGGYLLWAAMTTKYVFDLKDDDVFWCTADVGWITGHSYLTYGPTANGATQVMFEGVPTWPQPDRFWEIVAKYKVSIFYTAPTAIRALMRLGESWPDGHDLSSLRLLGSVGEPINPEAWKWYHRVVGRGNCPVVDTWWQTETGGIMLTTLPGAHDAKPGSAGFPMFGIQPAILRTDGTPAEKNEGGSLCITKPWPGMLRGVYGDAVNERIRHTYFAKFPGIYFSGDGCRQDDDGYYWLLGRMDDVINVSAHRFATAEFESSLVGDSRVAEAAVVGYPHETKGQGVYCFVTLKQGVEADDRLRRQLVARVREDIGPIAKPDKIHFTPALPKTRSGKIMRRILRKIAEGDLANIGDTSTLADPSVVDALLEGRQ
ncbi:MAG: acetate--CoA ligase [Verrucomicrobia bacterium]|nr:acetate--CoA ligase [Verrucomicrobiota bacterium]MCH8525693.1 acetate--CoA ligase [Kiritimatiellia bacterium]